MPSTTLPDVTTQDQLRALLEQQMPQARVVKRGAATLVAKGDWETALAQVNKKGKVTVGPWVLGMGMASLWTILMMITGIGIVIWAVVALPKHQQTVKDVMAALDRAKQ